MTAQLTLVLPAHNEGKSIRAILLEIDSKFELSDGVTIFVSEDGSRDETRAEVLKAKEQVRNIQIVLSSASERLGYSRAVLRGIRECKTQLIGFMDSDGQFDPSEIRQLREWLSVGKVVVGFRNPRVDSWVRKFYSRSFELAYLLLGGPKLKDPSSPFLICLHRDVSYLSKIEPHLEFGFWWEFQYRVHKKGLQVIERPVKHRARYAGKTQVYALRKIPKIVITHFKGLIQLKRELSIVN